MRLHRATPYDSGARDGNDTLVVALDINDSVGVIDSHFPDASFFTEFERFDRHLDKVAARAKGSITRAIARPTTCMIVTCALHFVPG